MSLSSLIHKHDFSENATATVATVATDSLKNRRSVANVASVTVANSQKTENDDAGSIENVASLSREKPDEVPAWCWRVILPDREILSFNVPMATRADIARLYPDAVCIEVENIGAA
ncbi:MAG: hypothetical protein LBQ75_02180 [Zoogloeaceae bacterium]|jgi:hypothetical protein|nr:hypothetical protein [Zoogloeaceae bacterium]